MKYRSKETIEAVGFQELVEIALATEGANIVNGVPWAFHYNGWPVTHEDDNTYLIGNGFGHIRFRRGNFLAIGSGNEIFTLSPEALAEGYTPADYISTDEERIDARDIEIGNHIRDKERLKNDVERLESELAVARDAYRNMRDFAEANGLNTVTTGDGDASFSLVDAKTGEPCPTHGKRLCTIPDKNHRHVAAHMFRREDEDPDGNVYIAPPESELEAIKQSLEP